MRANLGMAVLLACGWATAAPIPKEKGKDKPKDQDAVVGTWRVDKFDLPNGGPPPGELTFTFAKDGTLTVKIGADGGEKKQGKYKLDPTANPKAIDLIEESGQTTFAIYELDGDTFKLCVTEGSNAPRPTEFKSDAKRETALVTFKRVTNEKGGK